MASQRTLQAAKQLVRRELKEKLKAMSQHEKDKQSSLITQKLLSLDAYKNARSLSLYLSMPSEVSTYDILNDVFEYNKKCYIPCYKGDNMSMVLLKDLQDYDDLPLTSWNIKQPRDIDGRETAIESGGLDLMILPGLGFTQYGDRLGRGKGYYDTYLNKYAEKFGKLPYTIGLAYSTQILYNVPTGENDVKLDHVIYA